MGGLKITLHTHYESLFHISRVLIVALACAIALPAAAQLPNGSVAPEFVYTDTDGETHDLYAYLNEGKTVIMLTFASWSGPCLNYYESGAMQELNANYGPEGSDDLVVLMVESDTNSSTDMDGTSPEDVGDFVTDNPLPLIQPEDGGYMIDWNVNYFPAIYTICSSGLVYESGQITAAAHLEFLTNTCGGFSMDNNMAVLGSSEFSLECGGESVNPQYTLANTGVNTQTAATIEISVDGVLVETVEWAGSMEQGQSEVFEIEGLSLLGGEIITVSLLLDDENPMDNEVTMQVSNAVAGTNRLRIDFMTDTYPEESSFEIESSDGTILISETAFTEAVESMVFEYYLPALDCYTIHFFDTYGDGLAGGQWTGGENGSLVISLLDVDGNTTETLLDNSDGLMEFEDWTAIINVTELLDPVYNICVFNDWDENGSWDGEEPSVAGIPVSAGDLDLVTGDDGCITIAQTGITEFSVNQDTDTWPVNTTPATISGSGVTNSFIVFGISPNDPNYNMGVEMTQLEDYFCNFDSWLYFEVTNQGNQPSNGQVSISIDELLTIVGYTDGGDQVDNIIHWDITELPVGQSLFFYVNVEAPNFEAMGELATNSVALQVFDPEGEIIETVHVYNEHVITCSYDPNDKQVWPAGETDLGYLPVEDVELEYLVRFQNTGNAAAFDIRVDDELSDALDWNTFEVITTSHYCEPVLNTTTGLVEFFFPDINLPDSTANEAESHGFVRYRIQANDVYEGLTVENTAYIYFDLNPAVVTNTTINTFSDEFFANGIDEAQGLHISTYPNPVNDQLNVNVSAPGAHTLTIIGLDGRVHETQRLTGTRATFHTSKLAAGVYFLRSLDGAGRTLETVRVVKG